MMKCFHVEETDGEHQQIVFAESRSKAIISSEAYEWSGRYIEVRAIRKPDYDKYAEQGYVPKQVLLNDGWWFECHGRREIGRCCKPLTNDDNPIVVNEHVYCSSDCLNNAGSESLRS